MDKLSVGTTIICYRMVWTVESIESNEDDETFWGTLKIEYLLTTKDGNRVILSHSTLENEGAKIVPSGENDDIIRALYE